MTLISEYLGGRFGVLIIVMACVISCVHIAILCEAIGDRNWTGVAHSLGVVVTLVSVSAFATMIAGKAPTLNQTSEIPGELLPVSVWITKPDGECRTYIDGEWKVFSSEAEMHKAINWRER